MRELLNRGARVVLVGRDRAKLDGLGELAPDAPVRVASTGDAASLDRALEGASAVVNCAGPFLATALPVAQAALRARLPYLDVAAEQAVTAALFDTYDARAKEAGIVLAPSVAFYGAVGDLLATAALGDWTEVDEVVLAYALDSWLPTLGSPAHRQEQRRAATRLHRRKVEALRLHAAGIPVGVPEPFGTQDAAPFATADQVTISRHVRTPEVRAVMNLAPLRDVRDATTPEPVPADSSGRSAQTFLVEAAVRRGGETRRAVAGGRDIYAVTAPLVVEALARILDGRSRATGVVAAGAAFDAADFLRALTPEHFTGWICRSRCRPRSHLRGTCVLRAGAPSSMSASMTSRTPRARRPSCSSSIAYIRMVFSMTAGATPSVGSSARLVWRATRTARISCCTWIWACRASRTWWRMRGE